MKKTNNKAFIRRMLYKCKVVLIGICTIVGLMAISDGPATVPKVQVEHHGTKLAGNCINEQHQNQPVEYQQDKGNKKSIRHNVKHERKVKEPKKNNSAVLGDFFGLCVLGVIVLVLMAGAFLVFLYAVDRTLAGGLLVVAALAGILFILIFIKLIKLGKKLGKKPKDESSVRSRNAVKANEEKAFVVNGR